MLKIAKEEESGCTKPSIRQFSKKNSGQNICSKMDQ